MPLLTGRGMDNILRRIMETGGLTESMEADVQRLRDDFNEREGILRRYGETYDGEDRDEYDWSEREPEASGGDTEVYTPREEDFLWESKYKELEKRYIDRFFGGVPDEDYAKGKTEEIIREQTADVIRDGEPQSFDELLYRVEGV